MRVRRSDRGGCKGAPMTGFGREKAGGRGLTEQTIGCVTGGPVCGS